MKRIILIGLTLMATNLWGQAPGEGSDDQLLCAPFAEYAADLLAFVERAEERGFTVVNNDTMRRAADATLRCAEAGTRLWAQADADAQLAVVESRFNAGISTSAEVSAARVAIEKARYCDAAFSHIARQAENYQRRSAVGLANPGDIAPFLTELEALSPNCGR